MGFGHGNQIDISVKTAVESEVGHLRINAVVGGVIHGNRKGILPRQLVGQIHTPGGITAVVVREMFPVQIDVGGGIGTVDFQIMPVPCHHGITAQFLFIHTGAAEIIVAAVLPVCGIPGMGQRNVFKS